MKKIYSFAIYIFFLVLLSCTRMVTLRSELNFQGGQKYLVSEIEVKAPLKDQNVFTFEDIVRMSNTTTIYGSNSIITVSSPGVTEAKRADFNYILKKNSDDIILENLHSIFEVENKSPYSIHCDTDFKYYLANRSGMSNIVGIYMNMNMVVTKDTINVFEKVYEANEEEKYSTAWITYPRNSTMNSLFNKALNKIMEQIFNDSNLYFLMDE